ncbi:hypothetical protein UA75_22030 [Actinoalloteichus sp. GBA129-24]|uniref:Uncharacterized protein n=2 Tax=Pseudonocardiaceae TaxID=2070 RepID=A0AAC9LES4_9PSEU|nr:hypothetical protein UA74_21555 [Actinoalloteichus fjordicus]APU22395.1 hypothetical protein UA75_22030 [Actinoalloteichus sp. GBA129-24]
MNADQRPSPMVLSSRRAPGSDSGAPYAVSERSAADHAVSDHTGSDHATAIAEVEEAVRLLDGLDELETAAHVARFDSVHAALSEALSGIDRI